MINKCISGIVLKQRIEVTARHSKNAADCTHAAVDDNHPFVDMDRVVSEIVNHICVNCPKKSSSGGLVPPVGLIRFSRGGKTLTLTKTFDKLKSDNQFHPIFISFNGSGHSNFEKLSWESHSQAILRLIAVQLGEYTEEEAKNIVVDERTLDDHLGTDVVLLIDELNLLAMPLDSDAARLLRRMFLDKAGRYLVFSSHHPINMQSFDASTFIGNSSTVGPSSLRGVLAVNMSRASGEDDFINLRCMGKHCEALTHATAAWYGYVPSLIYTTMIEGFLTPKMRFDLSRKAVQTEHAVTLLHDFVQELLEGNRHDSVAAYYQAWASVGVDYKLSYPLCYVKCILEVLKLVDSMIPFLIQLLEKAQVYVPIAESGLDWEATVQLAVCLRILHACWFNAAGPFGISPIQSGLQADFRTLPPHFKSVKQAAFAMKKIAKEYAVPTLIYFDNSNAKFEEVEGYVMYTTGDHASVKIRGFQAKRTSQLPKKAFSQHFINEGAVLLRGLPKPPAKVLQGWTYYTTGEVRDFIGTSLQLAMPRDLLVPDDAT